MYIIRDAILSNVLIVILALLLLIIIYYKKAFTYWSKRNVISISPTVPFGNLGPYILQKSSIGEQVANIYNQLKHTGKKYAGIYVFSQPVLLLMDPELCKLVMTKDYSYFIGRDKYSNAKDEPLTGNLFFLSGTDWKNMRTKLTPTFTCGKMKMMFHTVLACSEGLEDVLSQHIKNGEPINAKDFMSRFTTDSVTSCAFGIDCNSIKNPDNEFLKHGMTIFKFSKTNAARHIFTTFFPNLFAKLGLKRFPAETSSFFINTVKDTVDYREKNNISRKDFLHLLMQLKSQGYIDGEEDTGEPGMKLTIEEIAAQCFSLYLAGFETSSTATSSFLYRMTVHQDIQDKVRDEIHTVLKKYDGKFTYESLMEMEYLEKVINETMRIHPVVPMLARRCIRDYKIPNSDLIIEKDRTVYITIKGFHEDPKYYPNPDIFDPERFSTDAKTKLHPYTFLPFGAGPMNCIGWRFGMMQMKIGLATLLKNHKFTLNPKTQIPLQQDPKCELCNILGGIWIDVERIDKQTI